MSDAATMIGRADETDAVRAFIEATRGGPAALVLTGEPGIGKSTLWREGLRLGDAHGFGVLQCQPVDAEAQLAFTSLSDLLVDVSDDELGALPRPQCLALEVVLLRAEPDGRVWPPRAVALATLGLLQQRVLRRPIVIGIDDAHWMDEPSQRVLAFVARRLRGEPVGFLIATRGTRESGILDDVDRTTGFRIIERQVAGLGVDAIESIVRDRLGDALPSRDVRKVHEMAGGNPMFALHLAQALIDRGVAPDGGFPFPDTLLSIVGDRRVCTAHSFRARALSNFQERRRGRAALIGK